MNFANKTIPKYCLTNLGDAQWLNQMVFPYLVLPKNGRLIHFPMCLGVLNQVSLKSQRIGLLRNIHFNSRALWDAYNFFSDILSLGAQSEPMDNRKLPVKEFLNLRLFWLRYGHFKFWENSKKGPNWSDFQLAMAPSKLTVAPIFFSF